MCYENHENLQIYSILNELSPGQYDDGAQYLLLLPVALCVALVYPTFSPLGPCPPLEPLEIPINQQEDLLT